MRVTARPEPTCRAAVIALLLAAVLGVCAFLCAAAPRAAWASAGDRLATWSNIAQTGEGTYADTTEDGIGLLIGSDGITVANNSGRDLPTSQFMLTMAASGIVYTYDLDAIPAGGGPRASGSS